MKAKVWPFISSPVVFILDSGELSQALNLLGISCPSVMEYLNKDMVHQTHQRIWWLKVQKPVIALSKLDQLEVDLINMSKWAGSNNHRRYSISILQV